MFDKKIMRPSLLAILILLAGGAGFYELSHYYSGYKVTQASTLAEPRAVQANADTPLTLKDIVQQNQKRVVQIMVQSDNQTVLGSGFLYDKKGDVITNAHVVTGAKMVTVKTSNSKTYTGKVIGIGDKVDVALIRVQGLAGKTPMKLDLSSKAGIGDPVIALGSPLGLQNTVTTGIISGINRDFTIGNFSYQNVYQISAPITHGNSGGPLLSEDNGEVLAINSAGTKEGNIGFSIPIQEIIDQVKSWSKTPEDVQGIDGRVTDAGQIDGEVSTKDAMDLVTFFYQSLNAGDYVTAYAQLGSQWQSKMTYEAFRNSYIHTISTKLTELHADSSKDGKTVTVKATVIAQEHLHNADRTSTYEMTYVVGIENNTLKLLDGSMKKIS